MDTIRQLLYKHSIGSLTPGEEERLRRWAGDDPERLALLSRLADKEYVGKQIWLRSMVDPERPLADMRARISVRKYSRRIHYVSLIAAVAVVFIALAGAVWFISGPGRVAAEDVMVAEEQALTP